MTENIPEYLGELGQAELAAVQKQIEEGWISPQSDIVREFEQDLAAYLSCSNVLAVDSGTAALHVAFEALDVNENVVVQDYTYGATGVAAMNAGGSLSLVDIEPDRFGPDPEAVKAAVGADTDAIVVVHLFGRPAKMGAILDIAEDYNVPVVEDACHAIGASWNNQNVGTVGDVGCFSFAWCKSITTGKGGCIVTDDPDIADAMTTIADYGRTDRYTFTKAGYNYRMDGIRAAIGVEQLQRLDTLLERKRDIFGRYQNQLAAIDRIDPMPPLSAEASPYFFYVMAPDRDRLQQHLAQAGIATRTFYTPLHENPVFPADEQTFPASEDLSSRILGLPSHPSLTETDVDRVAAAITSFYEE